MKRGFAITLCAGLAAAAFAGPVFADDAKPPTPVGVVLAAGDISTCKENKAASKVAEQIRKRIKAATVKDESGAERQLPVKVIALGDLVYGKGSKNEFKCYLEAWSNFDKKVDPKFVPVLVPVIGNHDYMTDKGKYFYKAFKDNPAMKQEPEKGFFQLRFPDDKGPWQLIGLNSNFYDFGHKYEKDLREEQRNWLGKALLPGADGSSPSCVMAFWHEPTLSSGKHGHNYKSKADEPLSKNRPLNDIWKILYDHGTT